jgi:tetratricopeptide (TPR) repeat protein
MRSFDSHPRAAGPKARRGLSGVGVVALFSILGPGACSRTVPLPPAPELEVRDLGQTSRPATDLVLRAEAALQENHLSEASQLLLQARQAAPDSGFLSRRHCEVLAALGRRDEALEACKVANYRIGSVVELRASVGAVMAGAGPFTMDMFSDANMMASGAQRLRTDLPWGYAAFADIAKRLGDREMMRINVAELERVAPEHGETKRAVASLPPRWLWARGVGWAALLLATISAVAQSASRRRAHNKARLGRSAAAVIVVCLASLGQSPQAAAAPASKLAAAQPPAAPDDVPKAEDKFSAFQVNDEDPAGHLPTEAQANGNPLQFGYLLMDLSAKAQAAVAKGDHKAAIKYYQALSKAVPGKSVSFSRTCREYEALGDRTAALAACREALGLAGVEVEDYDRYVRLTLDHPGAVTAVEKEDIVEIIKHLRASPSTRASASDLECQLAARLGDVKLLETCVADLLVTAPRQSRTVTYQWSLALHKGDAGAATRLIEQAKRAGVQSPGIAKMVEATAALRAHRRLPIVGLLIAAAALILGLYFWRTRAQGAGPSRKLAV